MIAQFLCVAVLLMVSVSTLVAHRLVIEHARQSAAQWARVQAQALGQIAEGCLLGVNTPAIPTTALNPNQE